MERENTTLRPSPREWETPVVEEISLSAEVTAYMGVRDFDED